MFIVKPPPLFVGYTFNMKRSFDFDSIPILVLIFWLLSYLLFLLFRSKGWAIDTGIYSFYSSLISAFFVVWLDYQRQGKEND